MDGTLQPDDVLSDRYRIERELGRGAMGVVYAAEDLRHRRKVAVKVLSPMAGVAPAAGRFQDEIHTAAQLNHPSILAVHDSGEVGGLPYYVTPRIDGETLRERLRREGTLPVEEAVRIVRLLADALGYAHARGVVHRDVKPENILLDRDGRPYLADFGVALSVRVEDDARRTSAGVAVGSPAYMSPEQATGERDVDGRSDLYALGCVLFEMVAGEHPYAGLTRQATLARQLTEDPPSLRRRRADVPPWLDEAVRKAMAREPGARYPTGRALAGALDEGVRGIDRRWRPNRRHVLGSAAILLVALFAAWSAAEAGHSLRTFLGGAPLDTLRYAVMPFRGEQAMARGFELAMHDALGRWREIHLVDRLQIRDLLERSEAPDAASRARALTIAQELGAGRYVRGALTPIGDSVDVEAVLYDANRRGKVVQRANVRVASTGAGLDARAAVLARTLLFGRPGAPAGGGTASLSAWRDYGAAEAALLRWDLPTADSLFRSAARIDPDFALAHLWVAQVSDWSGAYAREWVRYAERAVQAADRLPAREALLARALWLMAQDRHPEACAVYDDLRRRDPGDFAALYGLGQCRARDGWVVRDSSTASGWRFRASEHQAVEAFREAFTALPSSHRGFTRGGFERIRDILFTRIDKVKPGRALDDPSLGFLGFPVWDADTLLVVPIPLGEEASPPASHAQAMVHQRRVFHEIATAWVAAFPDSPDALHALAVSQEMLGDPVALETLVRARELVPADEASPALVASEVWLRVKLAAPADLAGVEVARALADSLLSSTSASTPMEAQALSELAALLGRPTLAARWARRGALPADALLRAPLPVVRASAALNAFAAVGAPTDSIEALEAALEATIRASVPAPERETVLSHTLERSAVLAFPAYVSPALEELPHVRSPVGRAQVLLERGEGEAAREVLDQARSARASIRPEDVSMDIVFAEAARRAALGDTVAALEALAPALDNLRWIQPGVLDRGGRAGPLVRAMALRASLAADQGDSATAAAWASTVRALWKEGEPSVAPVVAAMRRLAAAFGSD